MSIATPVVYAIRNSRLNLRGQQSTGKVTGLLSQVAEYHDLTAGGGLSGRYGMAGYLWTGEVFEIIGGRDSAKMRHVELNGRAALCIDKRGNGAFHVTAEGPCELGGTATKEWRLKLHTHYRGAEAAGKIIAGDGHLAQRFMTLRPERWYGWNSSELE